MTLPYLWSWPRLPEALTQLARRAGLLTLPNAPLPAPPEPGAKLSDELVTTWVEQQADRLGIEAEAVYATYAEVETFVQRAAPALLWLPPRANGEAGGVLVLLKGAPRGHPRRVALLTPTLTVQWVAVATVRDWLCQAVESSQQATLQPLLDQLGLQGKARVQTYRALLQQQIGKQRVASGWVVRLSPGAPVWQQVRQAQLPRPLWLLLGSYLAQLGLTAGAWWLIGRSALQGHFTWAGLWAWALLLFTAIPLRLLTERAQQRVSTICSLLSKQRLLYGILRLQPEQIRHQGAGQFFGQVMEADSLDNLALGGGLVAGLALLQAGLALALLSWAAPLRLLPALLLGWLVVVCGLAGFYLQRQRAWLASYRSLSSDLIERMVGHRTRLAQEPPAQWHEMEDTLLARYAVQASRLDQVKIWLMGSVTRGWMVLALSGLALTLTWAAADQINLPLALAGILLALQALTSIANGVVSLVNAAGVWGQVRPLFAAASERLSAPGTELPGAEERPALKPVVFALEQPRAPATVGQPLLIARDLAFRYRAGGRVALQAGNLQIQQGERLLLAGPSGSGKSTLASLLAGLRTPSTGLLLLHGYDRQTLGADAWRRRVMLTPQFHENHIFTGTLAFNLLLGRCWPPRPADLQAALELCQELGLGELLERMPAGLQQIVGESGWRLSHGERSRVYIARTLLQRADFMILDESFAALDPETMQLTLACVLRRAPTLLVIAHP